MGAGVRILTAREQLEMLRPWLIEAGPRTPPPDFDQLVRNVLDHWDSTTDQQRKQGAEWYPAAREWLKNLSDRTNGDYRRSAGVIAALSPMLDWETNLAQGAHFLMNYDPSTYKPQNVDPGLEVGGVSGTSNIDRARRVYHANPEDIEKELYSGGKPKKVWNFWQNFLGDDNAVTIDRHMARAVLGEKGGLMDLEPAQQILDRVGNYDHMADAIRTAAGKRGVSPAAMQAAIWLRVNNADYSEKPWDQPKYDPVSGQLALDLENPQQARKEYWKNDYPVPEYTGRPTSENRPAPPPFWESPNYQRGHAWQQPSEGVEPTMKVTPRKKYKNEREELLKLPQSEFALVAHVDPQLLWLRD